MPAASVVEELRAARARKPDDVLDVGRSGGKRTHGRWIEHTAAESEERHHGDPACDLEPPARDVPVGDSVTGEVQERAERSRHER
jgi:hypothetical protein